MAHINLDMLDEETKVAPTTPDLRTPPEQIAAPSSGNTFLLAVPDKRQRSSGPLGLRSPQLLRESMRGSRLADNRGTSLRKVPSSTVSHMLTRSLSQLSEIEKELDQSSASHLEVGFQSFNHGKQATHVSAVSSKKNTFKSLKIEDSS